jgi:hypothetical protein
VFFAVRAIESAESIILVVSDFRIEGIAFLKRG